MIGHVFEKCPSVLSRKNEFYGNLKRGDWSSQMWDNTRKDSVAIDIDLGKDQLGCKADKTCNGVGLVDELEEGVKIYIFKRQSALTRRILVIQFGSTIALSALPTDAVKCGWSPECACVCPIWPALRLDSRVISLSIQAHLGANEQIRLSGWINCHKSHLPSCSAHCHVLIWH